MTATSTLRPKSGKSPRLTYVPATEDATSISTRNMLHLELRLLDLWALMNRFFSSQVGGEVTGDIVGILKDQTDGELLPSEFVFYYDHDEGFRGDVDNQKILQRLVSTFSDRVKLEEDFRYWFALRNILRVESCLADLRSSMEQSVLGEREIAVRILGIFDEEFKDMVDGEHLPHVFLVHYYLNPSFRDAENNKIYDRLMDRWADNQQVEKEFGFCSLSTSPRTTKGCRAPNRLRMHSCKC